MQRRNDAPISFQLPLTPVTNKWYLLKESLGQLWSYRTPRGVHAFFERWKQSLHWQRLAPHQKFGRMIERSSGTGMASQPTANPTKTGVRVDDFLLAGRASVVYQGAAAQFRLQTPPSRPNGRNGVEKRGQSHFPESLSTA